MWMNGGKRADDEVEPGSGRDQTSRGLWTNSRSGAPSDSSGAASAAEGVSQPDDLMALGHPIFHPRYLGGGAQPGTRQMAPHPPGSPHGPAGSMDLSAIEAILRSPIDSQGNDPTRAAGLRSKLASVQQSLDSRVELQPGDEQNGEDVSGSTGAAPLGTPRTALLGRADRDPASSLPDTFQEADGLQGEGASRPATGGHLRSDTSTNGSVISARAFQRFKRPSAFAPRTAFLQSPAAGRRPARRGANPSPAGDPGRAESLSRTEAFLDEDGLGQPDGHSGLLDQDPGQPLLSKEEIDAFFSPSPLAFEGASASGAPAEDTFGSTALQEGNRDALPPAIERTRPTWLKSQVADLADLVQALDLQARAHHAHVGLEDELARLRQFTRTVGFVASPPPRGDQEFDMATLTEEALGALAGKTPNAPRILFRKRGDRTSTRADKSLVAAALDAVLQTAIACAGSGDVVRVTVEGRSQEPIVTDIEFPAGPLSGLHPDAILAPYGLRKILPEIGPNALAAAGAIAVGQGGDLALARDEKGVLTFSLELAGTGGEPEGR